jgi:predicted DNA repair protein MutK
MASGLIALLDDVAAIAKVAATSLDDVAAATAKAGAKSAGVVIDDAAVTPTYVTGFSPDRELPIIWKIAKGSLSNKLVFLMPGFIALAAFLPQALTPLLMLGGTFLCFEAAEKVMEKTGLHGAHGDDTPVLMAAAERETSMVNGAIRTDLILSAEILAIALGQLEHLPLGTTAAALAGVSVAVTALVYGAVALIVKMDDVGLKLAGRDGRLSRAVGRGLVTAMPRLLAALSIIGTAAMAWVGGGIVLHGMEEIGLLPAVPHLVNDWAHAAGTAVPAAGAAVAWIVHATLAGVAGVALGFVIATAVGFVARLRPQRQEAAANPQASGE